MPKKSQTKINSNEVSEQFSRDKHKYNTLGTNLVQALKLFLDEKDVKVLSVNFRTKNKDSFVEKIERKNYENPFDDIEDICGIRIICYYRSDVDKIADIITKEFEVLEKQDKEELLEDDQFGYRSTHFIVKIKNEWLKAPNYRTLENLKAEIQIRTVLMHAWAEIEHKLAYKKKAHIPKQFKRDLFSLAASLELADKHFEILRKEITSYQQEIKEEIVEISETASNKSKEVELNLDSLQAFLNANIPHRKKDISETTVLLDQLLEFDITLRELSSAFEKVKDYLPKVEKEIGGRWIQVGVIRAVLDLTDENYSKRRKLPEHYLKFYRKWREIIEKDAAKNNAE